MSTSDEHSSTCDNCGTINTNQTICIQCQSELPIQTSDNIQSQLLDENNDQQIPLIHQFQNLFNNDFDIQSFNNILLPMLISQIQFDLPQHPQHRHRRGRPPRRIKRITHSSHVHRYLPSLDISPFQTINTPTSLIQLLNINELVPGQVLNTQVQSNMALVQIPLQLFSLESNRENFNSEMLTQLLNEDQDILPVTINDINQLPILTMTSSNLLINPSCAICLENFELLSEVKQLPICHHVFHINCLTEWLLRHGNCPMCRTIISSTQQIPITIFNDQWMQQLFLRTFQQQQQSNTIVPYHPVKTTNPLQISLDTIVSNHSLSYTPQLPRFDSSSNIE
ncbi:unnamed protein product [Adineta steineri]|uniref:RING-type domain-containing protein n=2 Tax=Adineta steineri TaxID=433720 RepID=A0A814NM09_9BILA|nr:unnamed protein product [Adineta steineri]CAF3656642.1 unnamed protein product [Adineta steineri]